MDKKLIEEINEKSQILDVVSEFVKLEKRGKNYLGLCPFHDEKTPSFSVSPEKNICKCMSCGEGGNPINFYRKVKNISFQQAAEELADRVGIKVEKTKIKKDPHEHLYKIMDEAAAFYSFNLKNSKAGQIAYDYLIKRELSSETITHFRLGYAPRYGSTLYQVLKDKGYKVSDMIKLGIVKQNDEGTYYDLFSDRIIFPITNPDGKVVGFSGRTLSSKDKIKYVNSPETIIFKKGYLLYHLHEGSKDIRKLKQIVLFEGFFDVISSYQAGVTNGVATMGTALTRNQAALIKRFAPSVVIAYDGDKAGQKATDRAIPELEKVGLKTEVLVIPEKMDPDDFIKNYGPEKYELLFSQYVTDPYRFRFNYYKQGLNLNNANDIKTFKNSVTKMLSTADPAIVAIYKKQLAQTLHIDTSDIHIRKPRPQVIAPKPIDREIKEKIADKNERAERYMTIVMLRSKEDAIYINDLLGANDYAAPIMSMIRTKIMSYYQVHDIMDISDFKNMLNEDQIVYLEKNILSDMFYMKDLDISKDSYDKIISNIKLAGINRRLKYLKQELEKIKYSNPVMAAEYFDLLAKFKKSGGSNGY